MTEEENFLQHLRHACVHFSLSNACNINMNGKIMGILLLVPKWLHEEA
jgi:hypothetical protein